MKVISRVKSYCFYHGIKRFEKRLQQFQSTSHYWWRTGSHAAALHDITTTYSSCSQYTQKALAHLYSISQTWMGEIIYIKTLFEVFTHFSLQRRQLVYNDSKFLLIIVTINLHNIWKFRFSGQEMTSKTFTEESMGIVTTIEESTFDSFLFSISQLH